jgi:hypothetical protein
MELSHATLENSIYKEIMPTKEMALSTVGREDLDLPFPTCTMGSRMIMYPIFLYDLSSSLGYI